MPHQIGHGMYDDTQLNEIPFMYSQSAAFSALPVDQQRALIIQFTNMTGGRPTDSNAFGRFINQQLGIGQNTFTDYEGDVGSQTQVTPPPIPVNQGLDLSGIPVGASTPIENAYAFGNQQYGPLLPSDYVAPGVGYQFSDAELRLMNAIGTPPANLIPEADLMNPRALAAGGYTPEQITSSSNYYRNLRNTQNQIAAGVPVGTSPLGPAADIGPLGPVDAATAAAYGFVEPAKGIVSQATQDFIDYASGDYGSYLNAVTAANIAASQAELDRLGGVQPVIPQIPIATAPVVSSMEDDATGGVRTRLPVPDTTVTPVPVTVAEQLATTQEFDESGDVPESVTENIGNLQNEVDAANEQFLKEGRIPQGFTFQNGEVVTYGPNGEIIRPTKKRVPKISTEAGTAKAQQDAITTPAPADFSEDYGGVRATGSTIVPAPTVPAPVSPAGEPVDLQAEEGVFATQPIPAGAGAVASTPSAYAGGLGSAGAMTGLGQQAYDLSLEPADAFRRYRARQIGEVPIGVLAGANLYGGYQPAYGRYLLNQASGNLPMVTGMGTQGGGFGEYLQSGQRRGLEDIRSSFGGLQNYLASLGGQTISDPQYAATFGLQPTQGEIVSASLAALGNRALGDRGARNLGNIFDLYQTQYGPQGASRFADFISTAFNPVAMGGM
tara:strand:+ start:5683 stop:7680 length:1998 start_codon:yes stop_codon:yes gene_type:complete